MSFAALDGSGMSSLTIEHKNAMIRAILSGKSKRGGRNDKPHQKRRVETENVWS